MAQLTQYRQIIQKILTEYRDWAAGGNQIGVQECVSFDQEHDQYLWFHVGWDGKRRDFGVTVYIKIEQGKIWIEEDWTKQGIANELLEAGIPAEDIVLGFQHPNKRLLTEFAVA
jgi:XisI protein